MRTGRVRLLAWPERALWIGLLVLVSAIRWSSASAPADPAGTRHSRAESIPWRTNLDAALAEARQTNRPVLVDFSASWCPGCIVMKNEVWPDAAVGRTVAASYVPVLVDVDRQTELANRFGVDSIPTVLVLDGQGHALRRAGFLPAPGMLRFLSDDLH